MTVYFKVLPTVGLLLLTAVLEARAQNSVLDNFGTNAPASTAPTPATEAPETNAPADVAPLKPGSDQIAETLKESLTLLSHGQEEAALAKVSSVLRVDPDNTDAHVIRGNIYTQQKNWDGAVNDYTAALQRDPKNFTVNFNMAEIKFRQKQYDAARAALVPLEGDANFGDLVSYKVFLCDLFGGHDEVAKKEYDAFNLAGSNPSYYFSNAAWDLVHNKTEDARQWLLSAANIYSPKKFSLYSSTLKELGYLPLPPPPQK